MAIERWLEALGVDVGLPHLSVTEEWSHWAVCREFPGLLSLDFSSGAGHISQRYFSCFLPGRYSCDCQPLQGSSMGHCICIWSLTPDSNYFLVSFHVLGWGSQLPMQRLFPLSQDMSVLQNYTEWEEGIKRSSWFLVFTKPYFSPLHPILEVPAVPCLQVFGVLYCVNQVDIQLSNCWLKFSFFWFGKSYFSSICSLAYKNIVAVLPPVFPISVC